MEELVGMVLWRLLAAAIDLAVRRLLAWLAAPPPAPVPA